MHGPSASKHHHHILVKSNTYSRVKSRTPKRNMGSPSVWCPVRQAIEQYNSKIRREIERVLQNIKTDGSSFLIRLCMIGRKGEKANPTIMIFSANRETSKIFEASVRRSGILDRYPDFHLSSSTIPLEAPPIPLKSERRARRPDSSTANWSASQTPSHDKGDTSEPRIGRKLERVVSSRSGRRVQHTTGGLIVIIGDELYQITGFGSMGATREYTVPNEFKACDFDNQSDPDDSGYEQEFTSEKSLLAKKRMRRERMPYRHGQQPLSSINPYPCDALCSPPPAYDGMTETSLFWKNQESSFTKSVTLKSTRSRERDASHYTLVKLTELESNGACNVVFTGEDHAPRGIDVREIAKVGSVAVSILVITSRGSVSGTVLPDMASLRLHGSTVFQTVHATILAERLGPEDCGSAVIDAVTGRCYGHIILTVEGQAVYYMVPISDTLADIVIQFGQLPSLELRRHTSTTKHSKTIKRWKCVNPRSTTNCRPVLSLGKCRSCSGGKLYSTRSRAAAHLRREHFPDAPTYRDEKFNASRASLLATDLKEWTREIAVTPLYAQVMRADSDSDSEYENDGNDIDDEPEIKFPLTSPEFEDAADRQVRLEKDNEDLRRLNQKIKDEVKILEGDVDVLMEDRDELKKELEQLRRKLLERDAQLVEAQLEAMLHIGCVGVKEAAVLDGSEL